MTKYFEKVVPLQKTVQVFIKNTKYYFSGINFIQFPLTLRDVFKFLSNRVIILHPCATLKNKIAKIELYYRQGDGNKSQKVLGFS